MPQRLQPRLATEFLARDPVLGPFVVEVGPVEIRPPAGSHFAALVRSICYQQLAGAAAATIHGRLVEALGGEVTLETVDATPDRELRGAGLSANKLRSVRDLAARAASGTLPLDDVERLPDDEVRDRLVTVRGIGPWTADMFLIFQLRRADVWPVGDLGVRAGYARLHHLDGIPSAHELEPLGEPYRPWRSAAAWYCWRAVETITPGD